MESSILTTIADNPALLEAMRKLLEKQFEAPTEMKSLPATVSDEFLGQFLQKSTDSLDVRALRVSKANTVRERVVQ